MNVALRQPYLGKLGKLDPVKKFLDYNRWNPRASMTVDVGALEEGDLALVERVLKEGEADNRTALATRVQSILGAHERQQAA